MHLAISRQDLERLLETQLRALFLLERPEEVAVVREALDEALRRTEFCFTRINDKYYRRDGQVFFNPFHGAQYSIFLYFLSHTIWRADVRNHLVADRVFSLNRALNGVDLFYEVELPAVFMCDHPFGSVIGRARFGSHFYFLQNCTVGNNKDVYPVIGDHVTLLPGATILGACTIGNDVVMAAHAYVRDRDIPSNSMVFGSDRGVMIKPLTPDMVMAWRRRMWREETVG